MKEVVYVLKITHQFVVTLQSYKGALNKMFAHTDDNVFVRLLTIELGD